MLKLTKRPLYLLLLAYFILASLYSVVTPLFEASDEQWHYPMINYLVNHRLALPVQVPGVETAYRQEGGQPPLYYLLSAILTFWIDTSDMPRVRNINPHADIGVIVPDGNYNMAIHDPAVESFPWRGTVLAVHLIRLFSVALGAITVAMTYVLTLELFPALPGLALGAAGFTAFNPMFLFISGSVNNDNLSNALASVLIVLIVRLLKRNTMPMLRQYALIGVVAGAGMLAKFNIGFLLPMIALSLALITFRLRNLRPLLIGGLITGLLTALIGGWWYVRNWQLYGDPTGLNVFLQIVGQRTIPAGLPQLWTERQTFLMSYWGFFGGVNLPLPEVVYTICNAIAAISVVGLLIGFALGFWRMIRLTRPLTPAPSPRKDGEGENAVLKPLPLYGGGVGDEANLSILLGRAVTVIWIVVLFVSLLRWTSATWASQGRLMFAAIAPLSMWMALGLRRLRILSLPVLRWQPLHYVTVWFVIIAVVALVEIKVAYGDPYTSNRSTFENPSGLFYEPGQALPSLAVSASSLAHQSQTVSVGDYVRLCPIFQTLSTPFSRNWSAFIHVENRDGLIVAQRDVYLGQGLWTTTSIPPAKIWCNRFAIRIPDYAYTQYLYIYLGLYDPATGDRMLVKGPGVSGNNQIFVGNVLLAPRYGEMNTTASDAIPYFRNPMSVSFNDEAELIGYDMSSLTVYPNQPMTVTLFWHAKRPMTTDYHVFVQLLQPGTSNVFASDDSMPAAWSRPTHTWQPDEIIEDKHTFTVHADAPPGMWQIMVGLYQLTQDKHGQQLQRLPIINPDGGSTDDKVELSQVKINPAQ